MAVNKCIKYLLFFFNLLFWVSLENKHFRFNIFLHDFRFPNTLTLFRQCVGHVVIYEEMVDYVAPLNHIHCFFKRRFL